VLRTQFSLFESDRDGKFFWIKQVEVYGVDEKEILSQSQRSNKFLKGFEHFKIEAAILSPVELLKNEKDDREFLSLVREGIVLWDKARDEA
jgi:hypothetical protein